MNRNQTITLFVGEGVLGRYGFAVEMRPVLCPFS